MTAHELIEQCAALCLIVADAHWEAYSSGGRSSYVEGCADTAGSMATLIRALKSSIPDGIICDPEPDCWIDPVTGESPPDGNGVPLYRAAKEP